MRCTRSSPTSPRGRTLTGESTPEGIVAALLAQGVQRVFLSMGADGILAGTRAELVHLPCLPTCMVNTTGGGHAVMAALVWAYLQGLDLRESAAAALAPARPRSNTRHEQSLTSVRSSTAEAGQKR
ncbi:MAG: carbohydrate kinase family protein [Oscillospiraceae bacterium]